MTMNVSLLHLEICVVALGLLLLLFDLWGPERLRRFVGLATAAFLGLLLLLSFPWRDGLPVLRAAPVLPEFAFDQSYVLDGLALFFKRFFLLAAMLVLVMATEFSRKLERGIVEYYSLVLFALAGMMIAASANNLAVLFLSIELITVSFYVLVGFQRRQMPSLEAGVKYLILGGFASALLIYGIALVFGTSGTMSFPELAAKSAGLISQPLFLAGLLLVVAGLGFKVASVPFQLWVPDVYQGAPTPTTAFLAVGSKAAGFVLLLRLFQGALPEAGRHWTQLFIILAGASILYGNLCAIPQTNLKRLLAYSGIANAGYLLMGLAAMSRAGSAAMLYYLGAYLFSVLAAFSVIAIVLEKTGAEDIDALAGLHQRSPFLAIAMTLAMVSLAGIPPLAGFFGKFLLIKSILEQGAAAHAFYWLAGVAIAGIVISLYYYFGVVRAIYWSKDPADLSPLAPSWANRAALSLCMIGMLYFGLMPGGLIKVAEEAVRLLRLE